MKKISESLPNILSQISSSDLTSIREFLFNDPTRPLICTGSGGAETAGDFAALLYGARYGVGDSISPLTFNSLSDNTLKSAKILLFSKGGHNNDIIFATKRALEVNPEHTMAINFYGGERNESRKLFLKAGSSKCVVIPVNDLHDGFVSCGTPLAYFALLSKVFNPETDLSNYGTIPDTPFIISKNDGTPLSPEDFGNVEYVRDKGKPFGPVAGICGNVGMDLLLKKQVTISFGITTELGVHMDYRNRYNSRITLYKNGLLGTVYPSVSVKHRFR